ncbi:class C sortase [Bifidobacterium adolescentis]|uniref:class C sortase n=1 Tax=Bifidobacterium adolescentis TaxID=1680 RepID=UPI001E2C691B|nr:class C sortase [Bifidobacterium adolescentis]MDB1493273.1 class C sortase [Bifidobacterium adolescentis]
MSKPVRLLARRTDSYVHAHTVLRSPMRLFGAVAGASADSYDAGDDNDGIGNGAGVGSDAGAAADSGHAGTVAFAGTSAGTFAGTPSFYEAIDIADVVRARRLRRIRFILVRCVSVLLIVGAVVVASLPFAMQAHSARRLAETSDSAARTVAGWPYPMAMEELERARAYNRRLAVEGQPVLGEAADPFTTRPAGTAGDADTADDSAHSGGSGLSAADTDANYQGLLDSGAGHLYGTSLPVGGTDSHTVVTGHRGLVKSLMFTRLDELHDGDFMYIKVMDETLGYEVDRISVIEPDDVSRLKIVPGEDRLTLMTCTPYGINTHRLLVSGHRVAIPLPAPDPADVRDERATELGALAMTIVCTMGGMLLCCMVVRSMRPRHRIMRHASAWPRKG